VWRQQGGNWRIYVFGLSMFALSWLAWRQLRGSRWRRARASRSLPGKTDSWPGLDSEFYAVTRRLEQLHGPRPQYEPLHGWIRRLRLERAVGGETLSEALRLHYRLRFDPRGLAGNERERLRELARLEADDYVQRSGR
jgi:hypothetical protein